LTALSSAFDSDNGANTGNHEGQQMEAVGMSRPSLVVLTAPGGFFHDSTPRLITSFNYPAMELLLGLWWWGELRAYYLSLTRDGNPCMRCTIAAGLGEMARILGNKLAWWDLLEMWQEVLHDAEDGETWPKALGGVRLFVGAIEGETRENIVGAFVELWERWLMGWRERECLTQALPALLGLVDRQGEVMRTLLGKALVDSMAAVREAAIAAVRWVT
jgi:serine/threonine-protein phosphatase 4 regulatory subunit 1